MEADHPEQTDPVRRLASRIAISPGTSIERLWTVMTDVALMPRLHPQVLAARWLDGAEEAAVGVRFATENADGDIGVWHADCRIVEYRPYSTIAWTIESDAAPPAVCRFDVLDTGDGITLEQAYFVDTRPGAGPPVSAALARGSTTTAADGA
jgi:Polyketide cyclase / dehydrase and lipid transport